MLRWIALLIPLSLVPGCGTISSYASDCPGVYSGFHYDRDLLREYSSDLATWLPEGRLRNAWDPWAIALDLPISALADTVTVPLGWVVRPDPDPLAHMGCRWPYLEYVDTRAR
ncbi:MAG: hypothetical protein ABFS46_02300 [Myxococcota bacterium]